MQQQYQQLIRKSWEDNPDKHPHRMAHFGSFALRIKHPLSVFDYGLDNYAGNAVYLEAHKQNTVNYSGHQLRRLVVVRAAAKPRLGVYSIGG